MFNRKADEIIRLKQELFAERNNVEYYKSEFEAAVDRNEELHDVLGDQRKYIEERARVQTATEKQLNEQKDYSLGLFRQLHAVKEALVSLGQSYNAARGHLMNDAPPSE